ncbi:hypothetical protein B7494_g6919 [Chlorociboria aeruginascens]|nr:hypothetical protein B7494_g6919 [Chlorociboria aeruginascens]
MSGLVRLWNNKFSVPPLPPPLTFKNHTILITGATSGLGLATAVHFANLGASNIIITARNASKGSAAKAAIESQSHPTGAKPDITVLELDMDSFASIQGFAEKVKGEVKSIDYVLLNAGLLNTGFRKSGEGWEETLQVNVLGTALVGLLLLPWIKEVGKGKAHLGVVGSGMMRGVDTSTWPKENILKYFNEESRWPEGGKGVYEYSKLMVQYIVNELAMLAGGKDGSPDVIVNSMCPGFVKSDLGRQYKTGFLMSAAFDAFMSTVPKSTEGGARTLVLAALTKPEENGKYITHYQKYEDFLEQVPSISHHF